MITLIAAVSENGVIGNKGKVPWNIPGDMKRFKELTINHPVIMGRKTYESLPEKNRPLPLRKNIVLSKTLGNIAGIYVARDIDEAIRLTEKKNSYVIGGEQIYKLFLEVAGKMEITKIHMPFGGDAFFPEVDWNEWNFVNRIDGISKKNNIHYSFLSYERRS